MKNKDVDQSKLMTLNTNQTVTGYKQFIQPIQADQFIKTGGTDNQILLANGDTSDIGDFLPKYCPHAMGQLIIEPSNTILDQYIRIMKNKNNWDSFVLTGCNADPTDRDGLWKMGSTSSQFRIQKQQDSAYDLKGLIIGFDCASLKFNNQLVAPLPIEYATKQTLDQAKPKFSGSSYNIPLNAIMYITKQATTPVVWLNPIPIDCFIDPDGLIKIKSIRSDKSPNGDRMAQYPR
ncbi:MAG: hypothetical protein EZS28_041798 [Streblomastix strix]|uniref:Uncharacterized protein n=1 Tax=Streblomastix strix TaxID=222440 RepID=A0A5J4TZ33_9EUKA|nr:MAG: hypothetical protein EZS28_041798 [Streblomastix strix]